MIIGRLLTSAALFTRFSAFSFTAALPLLGAATVAPGLSGLHAVMLVGIALAFHVFGYVLNDVVDLPIDRTHPLRQHYPLVRGTITPRAALVVALIQVPVACVLALQLAAPPLAYATLAAAFGLLAVYDIWGKRTAYPLLMDLLQGLGCCALVLFGTAAISGRPSQLTALICMVMCVYLVLINGVHGGLRDLTNDFAHGVLTTPILMGVRPSPSGLIIPRRFVAYALGLQVLLVTLVFTPLSLGWLAYKRVPLTVTTVAEVVMVAVACLLLVLAAANLQAPRRLATIGTWHIVVLLSMVLMLLFPMMGNELATTLLVVYLLPLCWTFAPRR